MSASVLTVRDIVTFADYEMSFSWFGVGSIPLLSLGDVSRKRRLPPGLVKLATQLERASVTSCSDLASDCDEAAARGLTQRLWRRAQLLAADGRLTTALPRRVDELALELAPSQIIELLATVIASSFTYDWRTRAPRRVTRFVSAVRRVHRIVAFDALRIAEQATSSRVSVVVCREFAEAMRVLFYALKRTIPGLANIYVPTICGSTFDASSMTHAWNWIVDTDAGTISVFDVTAASTAIDLSRYRNVTAFLGSAYALTFHGRAPARLDDVGEVMQATIEPNTERGLALLFHLAQHFAIPRELRARIAAHLDTCDFEQTMPDWPARLARHEQKLGPLARLALRDKYRTSSLLAWLELK